MNAALIAQLIVALGPTALDLIPKLTALWGKPTLTPDEVNSLCSTARKSYDDYIAEARAARSV
jgi:hypothetical protein